MQQYRTISFLLLVVSCITHAAAGERLWLTGGEVGEESSYAYLGMMAPLGGERLGNGPVYRFWLDHVEYSFDSGDETVDAEAPGAELVIGYQWPTRYGSAAVYTGPTYRDTDLSPSSAESDVKGGRWGAKLQAEGSADLDAWRTEGILSFIAGLKSYWGRVRLGYLNAGTLVPGIELIHQGDSDYHATTVGVFLGNIGIGSAKAAVKSGVRFTPDVDDSAYIGLELSLFTSR